MPPDAGPDRLTAAEALMWEVERDPTMRSSFTTVTILDGDPDVDRFGARLAAAAVAHPRLRSRVVASPVPLAAPVWEPDADFDVARQVRTVVAPAPGDQRRLLDLAADDHERPFEPDRPPWRYTLVHGLEGGRAALLSAMHHTITDGVGGVRLSASFIDLERSPADAPAGEPPAGEPEGGPVAARGGIDLADDVASAITEAVRGGLGVARRAAVEAVALALKPGRLPGAAGEAATAARSLVRQLSAEPARSPLWTGHRSGGRRFEVGSAPLEDVKAAARALGGTVNDAFLTVLLGAAAAYHRHFGFEVEELRVAVPISTRGDRSAGGNAFTPARVLLPAGERDVRARFAEVHAKVDEARSDPALGLAGAVATVAASLPPALLVRIARASAASVDLAASNVRGAPVDLFVGGARIEAIHPFGPTSGTAANATVLSYRGELGLGLSCDVAAVADPPLFARCLTDAWAELLATSPPAAASRGSGRPRR